MIGYAEATDLVLSLARPLAPRSVPIESACGMVLAESVAAPFDAPTWPLSAMDGYGVRESDLESLPVVMKVVRTIYAGGSAGAALAPGECCRIFTGAPVPAGADRVVVQEIVRRDGELAVFESAPGRGHNIRLAGSDFRAGEVLVAAGTPLNAQAMVAAAAADRSRLRVHPRPKVVVLSTGDELVAPGRARLTPGAIPESVSFGVAALVAEYGGEVVERARVKDDPVRLQRAARTALELADVVVITGGASVGEKDFAKTAFAPLGLDLVFEKVAIKPGKPVWIGKAKGRLVVGLPGNPTSAMVTARLFLAPLIAGLAGRDPAAALAWRGERLGGALPATGDRDTFVRAAVGAGGLMPIGNQDSGAQGALVLANRLIRREAGTAAGSPRTAVKTLDF